jgi:hypothetical protein
MAQELPVEETRQLSDKAEVVHLAALNLANTVGAFRGINAFSDTGRRAY